LAAGAGLAMIVIQDINRFSRIQQGCVATIGKFDGVHLGHQLILDQLKQKAEQLNLPALVILFEPHPEEYFATADANCPARLTTMKEKLELLESLGIDYVYQLKFDEALSQLSAESYIKEILVEGLGLAALVIGNDFRFGHKRQGDYGLLQAKGAENGFEVIETSAYERNGQRISSTFIREQLLKSNFKLVELLLGRPYSMKGEVVKGQQLGKGLGFPTCNVNLHRRHPPFTGIYACEVKLNGELYKAAVNIGYRPTVSDNGNALLEAHLLDFQTDVYGKSIEVIFRHKVREEEKFDNLDELKQQIGLDVQKVRTLFA
jgi:riboflavin kinase/FMN adenylyltransferase